MSTRDETTEGTTDATGPGQGRRREPQQDRSRARLDRVLQATSELLIEGMRHRLRIVEVPITIRARQGGTSKKPKNAKYAWHFTKAIFISLDIYRAT